VKEAESKSEKISKVRSALVFYIAGLMIFYYEQLSVEEVSLLMAWLPSLIRIIPS
jgi:hypothetical protein